jgi:ribosomal protein L32E
MAVFKYPIKSMGLALIGKCLGLLFNDYLYIFVYNTNEMELILKSNNEKTIAKIIAFAKKFDVIIEKKK